MSTVRRSLAVGIVLLAIIMKAPIWYLTARVSELSGGDGYHRSHLMDMAYQNLDKWMFFGMPITETRDWFAYTLGDQGADMTNQYLAFGISAGLLAMGLLIVLFVVTFGELGKALSTVRASDLDNNSNEVLLWGFGVVLLVHCINFLGITYFDQTYVIWFFQLAAISCLSESCLHESELCERVAL